MKFPSKKTIDSERKKFTLLPADDYLLEISEVKVGTQQKYKSTEQEEVVNFTFNIISFADGSEATDIEGKSAINRKVFYTGRPDHLGFMKDGTASKFRCLIAYTTKQDIFEELVLENWEDLLGKQIKAEIVQYMPEGNPEKKNKIVRFLPSKKERKQLVDDADIPIIEDEEINEDGSCK